MDSLEVQNSSGEFGCDFDPDDTAAESPGPSNTREHPKCEATYQRYLETPFQTASMWTECILKRRNPRKWSDGERAAVFRHLGCYIDASRLPGKGAIEACIREEPALKDRSWINIKNFCKYNVRRKRINQPS